MLNHPTDETVFDIIEMFFLNTSLIGVARTTQHLPLAFIWKILKFIQYFAGISRKSLIVFLFYLIKKPIKQIDIWIVLCYQGKDIALKPSSVNWNLEGVELPLDRESRFFETRTL